MNKTLYGLFSKICFCYIYFQQLLFLILQFYIRFIFKRMIKKALRKKYMAIKLEAIRKNDYHNAIRQQFATILSTQVCQKTCITVGSYIHKINTEIIPPYISHFNQSQLSYAFPYFQSKNKSMEFHLYDQSAHLYQNSKVYGIKVLEKRYLSSELNSNLDIVLVPLTAFNPTSKNRLGYGGGYYDNFVKTNQDCLYIGVGLECLKLNEQAQHLFSQWDQPMDYIITEKCVY